MGEVARWLAFSTNLTHPPPSPYSEPSAILSAAAPRSLVVLDELGRGTSTRLTHPFRLISMRSETSAILSAATPRSLVILDELGRGTSTGDGAAIAEATLAHLVTHTRPLTLFITQ